MFIFKTFRIGICCILELQEIWFSKVNTPTCKQVCIFLLICLTCHYINMMFTYCSVVSKDVFNKSIRVIA